MKYLTVPSGQCTAMFPPRILIITLQNAVLCHRKVTFRTLTVDLAFFHNIGKIIKAEI